MVKTAKLMLDKNPSSRTKIMLEGILGVKEKEFFQSDAPTKNYKTKKLNPFRDFKYGKNELK